MAQWTTEKTIEFFADVPAVEDGGTVFHQLKCKHQLELFQNVLELKQNMAGRSKQGSSSQATDPFSQVSSASAIILSIDIEQFGRKQDEATRTQEAIRRKVMGSIERSGLMFWGHPLRDFLPVDLPEEVIVQLKIRKAEHVPIMDILVKGQFRLAKGKLFSCFPVGEEESELWEGQMLSDFDEEMLLTLLWERPLMRYSQLPGYLQVKEYAYLAVFAVSQQFEVFEQLPLALQTHEHVIEAAIVKDYRKAKDFLPASVLQQDNVKAMLMKCETAETARKALLDEGSAELSRSRRAHDGHGWGGRPWWQTSWGGWEGSWR